jgi:PAS domain S-box-containing protein
MTRRVSPPWARSRWIGVPLTAAALGVGLLAWTEWESWTRLREMEALVAGEGGALVAALGHAIEHALVSSREIEEIATTRLLDQARLLDRLDAAGVLAAADLDRLAVTLGLSRISVLDARLQPLHETPARSEMEVFEPDAYLVALAPLAEGSADEVVLGARRAPGSSETRFAAAVRRTRGGAVLVVMNADEVLAFQDEIGVEGLMETVAVTGGILYAVLEDDQGGVLAGVGRREGEVAEALVLERPILIGPGRGGVLRVGLARETVAAAARAGRRRAVAAGGVALALAVAAAGVLAFRRRAEVLRGETARARSLTDTVLDGITDAVIVTDADGVLRLVNPAAAGLFGADASILVGSPCTETPCAAVLSAMEGEQTPKEIVLRALDGGARTVLVSSAALRDEEGNLFGRALVLRDLTEIKELEREARRTESLAAFGRLAAAVAHEVRNPLNAIAVGVQRLEREYRPEGNPDGYRHLAQVLRSEILRLDGIVTRFLGLARTPRLTVRPGDPGVLLRELTPVLADGLPPGVRLLVETDGPPDAQFDADALRQVLHNLVRNAAEAVGGRGTIRVSTRADGPTAVLEVADDGPGIAPADLERVFEFGFTTRPEGNGLGLPMAHRLVSEMGGSVTLESTPGRGATARVTLLRAEWPSKGATA